MAYMALVFLPTQREMSRLRSEINNKQTVIGQTTSLTQSIQVAENQRAEAVRFGTESKATLAAETDLPVVFARISETASAAGAKLLRFDPQPGVRYEEFQIIAVKLQCQGTLAQVFETVRRLEAFPERLWVDEFHLEKSGDAGVSVRGEVNLLVFADFSGNSN